MYQKPSVGVSVEAQQEEQRTCRPAENRKVRTWKSLIPPTFPQLGFASSKIYIYIFQPNEERADDKQEKGLDGAAMGKVAQAARQLEGNQRERLQLELVIGSAYHLSLPTSLFSFSQA